jgi:hypothetical protein
MKALSVHQPRIEVGPGDQLVTFRADIRDIEENVVQQLALETE